MAMLVHDRIAQRAIEIDRIGKKYSVICVDDHVAVVGKRVESQDIAGAVDARAADPQVASSVKHATGRVDGHAIVVPFKDIGCAAQFTPAAKGVGKEVEPGLVVEVTAVGVRAKLRIEKRNQIARPIIDLGVQTSKPDDWSAVGDDAPRESYRLAPA